MGWIFSNLGGLDESFSVEGMISIDEQSNSGFFLLTGSEGFLGLRDVGRNILCLRWFSWNWDESQGAMIAGGHMCSALSKRRIESWQNSWVDGVSMAHDWFREQNEACSCHIRMLRIFNAVWLLDRLDAITSVGLSLRLLAERWNI